MDNTKNFAPWVILILTIVIIVLVLLSQVDNQKSNFAVQDCVPIVIDETDVCLWVADNEQERIQGLSDIALNDVLEVSGGMIFIFEESDIRNFWMNHMMFDLDVLWIADGIILKIDTDVPRHISYDENGQMIFIGDPAQMSSDPYEVDQVIELFAGYVDLLEIEVGDRVKVDEIQ